MKKYILILSLTTQIKAEYNPIHAALVSCFFATGVATLIDSYQKISLPVLKKNKHSSRTVHSLRYFINEAKYPRFFKTINRCITSDCLKNLYTVGLPAAAVAAGLSHVYNQRFNIQNQTTLADAMQSRLPNAQTLDKFEATYGPFLATIIKNIVLLSIKISKRVSSGVIGAVNFY